MSRLNEYVTEKRDAINAKRSDEDQLPVFILDDRVKVIPDGEVYEFYRHRSGGLVLPWSPDRAAGDDGTKRIERPAFVAKMKENFAMITADAAYQRPVHYYIDEAHNFFDSREWSKNGRATMYYASQHRHLHDNIRLITQVMENVENRLRTLVSETAQCRNQLRRRLGPVRMRPIFRIHSYYGVPTGGVKPYSSDVLHLDVTGVASCYQTVGALGVHKAPEQKKNKGWLPWWVLPIGGVVAVLLVGLALVGLPLLGGKMGSMFTSGAMLPGDVKKALPGPARSPSEVKSEFEAANPRAAVPAVASRLFVRGIVRQGASVIVTLTDGSVYDERDGELEKIGRGWVVIRGQKYRMAPMGPGTPAVRAETPVPAALPPAESPALPIAPDSVASSWQTDSDGVSRLVDRTGVSTSFSLR